MCCLLWQIVVVGNPLTSFQIFASKGSIISIWLCFLFFQNPFDILLVSSYIYLRSLNQFGGFLIDEIQNFLNPIIPSAFHFVIFFPSKEFFRRKNQQKRGPCCWRNI